MYRNRYCNSLIMGCNNLGIFSYDSTSPNDLCNLPKTITLYGDSLTITEIMYVDILCSSTTSDGYYSDGNIVFEVIGNTITGITGCTCSPIYCINNTGTIFDDNYDVAGVHNTYGYYTGSTNGYVIYYSTGETQWCLSTVLDGSCGLFGQSPCINSCPDLCDELFFSGACPTPTPTPTAACNIDFDGLFVR